MSGHIITENINQEFKNVKSGKSGNVNRSVTASTLHGGGAMMRSALLQDKSGIPKNVQRKMANASLGNVRMGNPSFYHPFFQNMNIMLPRDRRERNEWCRHFYRTEPIIATSLDLHTEFPISDFSNVCSDSAIKSKKSFMPESEQTLLKSEIVNSV